MPSARELLEQADALMRRNRSRETLSPAMGPRTMAPVLARRPAPGDFPVLTDALEGAAPPSVRLATPASDAPASPPNAAAVIAAANAAMAAEAAKAPPPGVARARWDDPPMLTDVVAAPPAPTPMAAAVLAAADEATPPESASTAIDREAADTIEPAAAAPIGAPPSNAGARAGFADVPVLTDAIAEIDAALLAVAAEGEPSIWNDEAMRGDDSVLGPAPKSIAVIPDAALIGEAEARNAEAQRVAASEAADSAASAAATAELIDEVRMQVLQRIDMFTDTGLREQLGERLKPIVDRASAELVNEINQRVGELLRTFVAEAIERELDRLRHDPN